MDGDARAPLSSSGKVALDAFVFRLGPDADLVGSLCAFCAAKGIDAACIVTCVGSLRRAVLRLASGDEIVQLEGPFEIVSLTGTLAADSAHLHVALSDRSGRTLGGHVRAGCPVFTTAEVVLAAMPGLRFRRAPCQLSGWDELVVEASEDS